MNGSGDFADHFSGSGIRGVIVISLHFMKEFFYHENTKLFFLFVFSSFRAFVINFSFGSGLSRLGLDQFVLDGKARKLGIVAQI